MRYMKTLTVSLIALFAAAAALRGQGNPEGAKFSKEGVEAAKAKDWNKAVDAFRQAVKVEPQDKKNSDNLAIVLLQRATAYLGQKNFDGAVSDLNEAIKLKPDDVAAHHARGYAFLAKSDWQNALQDYNIVVEGMKNDPEPHERRAYVEMQLKDYDKAIADYTEAIKLKPKEARLYGLRAYAYQLKDDLKAALADTEKVLQIDPNNADAQARKKYLTAKANPAPTPVVIPSGPIGRPGVSPGAATTPPPPAGATSPKKP